MPDTAARRRPGRGSSVRWPARVWPPLVAVALVIVAWQVVADQDRYLLPRPSSVLSQLVHHGGSYVADGRVTLVEALAGLAIGFAAGVVLAVVMITIPVVERGLYPLAVLANVTPVVALAPALVVAFGFGAAPKVIVVAVLCFFPTLVNALLGLRGTDPAVIEVLRSLHASQAEVLWRVRLPSCLPFLFAAARVCVPLSVTGAVVAELVAPGSSSGLGTVILEAGHYSQLARIYAAIICLGALSIVLTLATGLLERRVLSWHSSIRHGA